MRHKHCLTLRTKFGFQVLYLSMITNLLKTIHHFMLLVLFASQAVSALPSPREVWKDFDPETGHFKEEIIYEKTVNGIYEKHAYISTYVNEVEIRVFCKYCLLYTSPSPRD